MKYFLIWSLTIDILSVQFKVVHKNVTPSFLKYDSWTIVVLGPPWLLTSLVLPSQDIKIIPSSLS